MYQIPFINFNKGNLFYFKLLIIISKIKILLPQKFLNRGSSSYGTKKEFLYKSKK